MGFSLGQRNPEGHLDRNFLHDKEREVGEEIHFCSLADLSTLVTLRAQCLKLQWPPFDHKVTSPMMKINTFILEGKDGKRLDS